MRHRRPEGEDRDHAPRPAAIVIGVEGQDWEDIVLQTSPAFWRLIEKRRKQETIPLAEARKRLEANQVRRTRKR